MNHISIRHIQSSYGKKQVLTDVSLEIKQGQCVGIVGANGCGKSTLLSILAGVQRAKAGEIKIDGQKTSTRGTGMVDRLFAGYVPQEDILIPELSVWDNLLLWYCDKRALKQELQAGFLKTLGLDELYKNKVCKLSCGQRRKVSIGCALAGRPQLLILDEPGAALDLPGKEEIESYLRLYKGAGGTIVLATHEERELELCDSVYLLRSGKAIEVDPSLRGNALAGHMLLREDKEQNENE